jgi:predicted dehydrogenase
MHYGYSKICLNAGLHVLCEKPLVLNRDFPNYDDAQEILSIAKARQRVITVNTQWPAIRHLISAHANCSKPRRFSMYVEPGTVGVDMLTDFLPHTNSLLISLFGGGDIEGLKFHVSDGEEIRISFDYHRGKNRCKTSYYLKYRSDRPRALNVAVNGVWFRRFIEEGYRQGFEVGGERFYIEDPFRTSIRKFLGAINEQDNCLVSYDEILANVKMQDEIVSEYARRKL